MIESRPRVRGHVRCLLRDATGRLVDVVEADNAFTNAYAAKWAKVLAGTNGEDLSLTHIALGAAGAQIDTCESATGWGSAPVVDATTFREGTASLKGVAAASTVETYAHPDLLGVAIDASAVGTSIELQLRSLAHVALDTAVSELRIYTSATDYYRMTLAAIEAYRGAAFADATWTLVRLPAEAFEAGAGAPAWAHVTGYGVVVAATASGTATLNWDDVRVFPASVGAIATATVLPNERSRRALISLEDLGSGQVRGRAFWPTTQAVGTYYVLGLFGNGGATLAAIVPLSIAKLSTLSLTVEWTVTALGG